MNTKTTKTKKDFCFFLGDLGVLVAKFKILTFSALFSVSPLNDQQKIPHRKIPVGDFYFKR